MSLSRILGTAVTGLTTNQTALRVTAANIANVNTEDYSRQVTNQESFVVNGESIGVRISGVERIVDRFLQAAGFGANSGFAQNDIQSQFHDRFQGLLGRPDSDSHLSARVNTLFESLAELSLNPADQLLRRATISSVQDVSDEISRLAQAIQDLRGEANQQISVNVAAVNEVLVRIHELNPLIVRQRAVGGETGGLENQRDKALQELSELIDIRLSEASGGAVHITTGSGTVLLDSALRELEYGASGIVASETVFQPIEIYRLDPLSGARLGPGRPVEPDIQSGALRGLLDLRDGELRDLSLTLGEFAGNFVDEINRIHNAHSALPAPNELIGKQTFLSGGEPALFTGAAHFSVVDSTGAVVSTYLNDFDLAAASLNAWIFSINAGLGGAGTVSISNGQLKFAATDPSHGVVISQDPVKPSDRGGQGFSHFFGMNDLLRSSVNANYATGLTGSTGHNITGGQVTYEIRDAKNRVLTQYVSGATGSTVNDMINDLNGAGALGNFVNFSLSSEGRMEITNQPGFEDVRLFVLSDTTNISGTGVTFTEQWGIGDKYAANQAKDISVLQSIANQPRNLAISSFNTSALVGEIALSAGDQTGAIALQELDGKIISFRSAGQLGEVSQSLGQYAVGFLTNAGLIASRAEQRRDDSSSLLNEVEVRIGQVSGVNLDEELANMVVLQTAYNASARIITTSREMFDEVLNLVR